MRELAAWPFMSAEPAMMVRLLVDSTEEMMSEGARFVGMTPERVAAAVDTDDAMGLAMEASLAGRGLAAVERALADWHRRKYGDVPVDRLAPYGVRLSPTYDKAEEEWNELYAAWRTDDPAAVAEEAADLVIVLFHFVRGHGKSLAEALLAKMEVNERRLTDPAAGRTPAPTPTLDLPGDHV